MSPGQALGNGIINKEWSRWLLKELVEAAAFRCSRCEWHDWLKSFKSALLIQTWVYRLSNFICCCFSPTGSGCICTRILVLQSRQLWSTYHYRNWWFRAMLWWCPGRACDGAEVNSMFVTSDTLLLSCRHFYANPGKSKCNLSRKSDLGTHEI